MFEWILISYSFTLFTIFLLFCLHNSDFSLPMPSTVLYSCFPDELNSSFSSLHKSKLWFNTTWFSQTQWLKSPCDSSHIYMYVFIFCRYSSKLDYRKAPNIIIWFCILQILRILWKLVETRSQIAKNIKYAFGNKENGPFQQIERVSNFVLFY